MEFGDMMTSFLFQSKDWDRYNNDVGEYDDDHHNMRVRIYNNRVRTWNKLK